MMSDIRLNFYQYSIFAEYQYSRLVERNFAKKWGEQRAGTDSQNRTARTGQAEQAGSQNWQDSQNRPAREVKPDCQGQDPQELDPKSGQEEQDSKKQDSQNRTARTGLPE
jgi:uncharacterized protein YdaU (DUF1376 family)